MSVGKRQAERESPRNDNSSDLGKQCVADSDRSGSAVLSPATPGSLGLDLATAVDVTLIDTRPQKVASEIKAPILINGQPVGALLIGRSSTGLAGLLILPGLIDKDYTGVIQIVMHTWHPPVHVPAHSRVAQLIPLPHLTAAVSPRSPDSRGDKSFGSTGGLALLTMPLHTRPVVPIALTHQQRTITIRALLDTGADITIVATSAWPRQWPTESVGKGVEGVGGTVPVSRSLDPITVTLENRSAQCKITVMPLPVGVSALVGRDVLDQLGVILTNSESSGFP